MGGRRDRLERRHRQQVNLKKKNRRGRARSVGDRANRQMACVAEGCVLPPEWACMQRTVSYKSPCLASDHSLLSRKYQKHVACSRERIRERLLNLARFWIFRSAELGDMTFCSCLQPLDRSSKGIFGRGAGFIPLNNPYSSVTPVIAVTKRCSRSAPLRQTNPLR